MTTVKWSPKRRYSAAAVFSDDLERVVLIHKLKPARQAGKANLPDGKVDDLACCLSDDVAQADASFSRANQALQLNNSGIAAVDWRLP